MSSPASHDIGGCEQRPRQSVDAADVGQIEVGRVDRLAAQLGVEVEAARAQPAVLDQLEHRRNEVLRVVGELIGVPAAAGVAAVDVERPEDAVRPRGGDLVLEIETGECGVVDLDVHLDFAASP